MTISGVVVPAVPPRPSQVNLLTSSVKAVGGSDPSGSIFEIGPEQLKSLPSDLRAELEARRGDAWVRGLLYAPENHYAAAVRDPCDMTSIDLPAIPAPLNLTLTEVPGGGTLAIGTYKYQVTAVNANGETTAVAAASITTTAGSGAVKLEWHRSMNPTQSGSNAAGANYNVYGRGGTPKRIASAISGYTNVPATGGAEASQTCEYTDTGAAVEGAQTPPGSNTTAGSGTYTNLAIVENVPYLVVVEDVCSSFGWEARDFKGRALRLLDNATPTAVENEFWMGTLAQAKSYPNNYLKKSATDLTPATAPSIERGLQILQDALAQCGFGGQGMIHCTPQTTASLIKVRRVGPVILDIFDNIVVPGAGYPNSGATGPTGNAKETPAEGEAWMYATDLVMTRTEDEGTVFPDSFAEAMDWGQGGSPNTIRFRAERFATAYFDGACQFAVRVKTLT